MRVVVISRQPALALALGTQIPGCDARSADSVEAVLDLVEEEGVVLVDVGSGEATERWLEDLGHVGLERRAVVIDDGDAPARDADSELSVRLHRPFSFAELAMALEDVVARLAVDAEQEREAQSEREPEPGSEPGGPSEAKHQPAVAPEPEPRAETWLQEPPPPPAEAAESLFDERSPVAREEAPDAPRPTAEPVPTPSAPAAAARTGLLSRLFSSRHAEGTSDAAELSGDLADLPLRINDSARSLEQVEGLVGELASLGDPHLCADLVLQEVADQVTIGGAALLLRTSEHHLEIAATTGQHTGVALGQVPLTHPYVQAVDRRGGGLLLDPTDEVRGLLAGVPLSSWQVLQGVLVISDGTVDALVLVGQPGPGDPADLDRLFDTVHDAAAVLRFAAAYRRLPRADAGSSAFLRSWMSGPPRRSR